VALIPLKMYRGKYPPVPPKDWDGGEAGKAMNSFVFSEDKIYYTLDAKGNDLADSAKFNADAVAELVIKTLRDREDGDHLLKSCQL